MIQELEIYKTKDGVTSAQLQETLRYGQELIGPDYLKRMKEVGLLGDASFVAELDGGVYLISYYLFEEKKQASQALEDIPSIKKYLERMSELFGDSQPIRIDPSNSFWVDAVVRERIG